MTTLPATARTASRRHGSAPRHTTLGWNVIGLVVLTTVALDACSIALPRFDPHSRTEIDARPR
ncbi:hypothetical protein [Streptomyces anandii]|uniref:MFS transporter n=1 Tax=Streptomyces anandii TaxID=285454 RepID=A0ABW6H5X6_9ACTN